MQCQKTATCIVNLNMIRNDVHNKLIDFIDPEEIVANVKDRLIRVFHQFF